MIDPSTLKPIHESVLDELCQANADSFCTLENLIARTKIPKGHDEIIAMLKSQAKAVGLEQNPDVIASLEAQKEAASASA